MPRHVEEAGGEQDREEICAEDELSPTINVMTSSKLQPLQVRIGQETTREA